MFRSRHRFDLRSAATAAAILAILSCARTAAADDVQPPELAGPQRGSVAGEYGNVAFGPADLARGGFNLPSPFHTPSERGAPLASIFPTYSADAGLGEWGLGWQVGLSITRWRVTGDLDYVTDEYSSPWGYLKRGDDGYWYPQGLQTPVRVELAADTIHAYLPDGAVWTFGGTARVQRAAGTYAWYLTDVVSATGRKTHVDYTANGSGRLFVSTMSYGGVGDDLQYRVSLQYEPVPLLFVNYGSGAELALDRRVKTVAVAAKHAQTGAFTERWHYDLTYQSDAYGPAYFLTEIDQVFASGERAPPVRYGFRSARDHLDSVDFVPVPSLDPILAQFGEDVIQPYRTAQLDVDLDGRPDLEDHTRQSLIQQTDAGFVVKELSAAPANVDPLCRPAPSSLNPPRVLAQVEPESDDWQVLAMVPDSWYINTQIDVCNRDGVRLGTQQIEGYWLLGNAENKLVDLNRDHLPDLITVGYGEYTVAPNQSTRDKVDFGAPLTGMLQPVFAPDAYWIQDFNGDGIVDLVARDSASLTIWFGLGNFQFLEQGQTFDLRTVNGVTMTQLGDYQFSFIDANRDGLTDVVLTRANGFALFMNNGYYLMETPIAAFHGLGTLVSPPVVADLIGSGDAQLMVTEGGHAQSMALEEPGTNLMSWADDGKGTVLRFDYARGPAAAGARQRHAVLSRLQVEATGYDQHVFTYGYSGPEAHKAGRFFLGFDGVTRQDGLTTESASYEQDEVVAGLLLGTRATDALTPTVVKYQTRKYDAQLFAGVPWMRLSSEASGWTSADGTQIAEARTSYPSYEAGVCPSVIERQDEHGTLHTERHRAQLSQLQKHLYCLEQEIVESGRHADKRLDFSEDHHFMRNAIGQVTQTVHAGALGSLIAETVVYNDDGSIASVTRPDHGTATFGYDPTTHLLKSVTGGDGVVTAVSDRDAVTDGIRSLTLDRGGGAYAQSFRFDGQERLARSWDNQGQASESNPDQLLAYHYANATQPASVAIQSAVELASGSVARAVDFSTARGESIVHASAIPEGWTFDALTTRTPSQGFAATWRRATLPQPAADLTTLDWATLSSGNLEIAESRTSSLDVVATSLTRLHVDVVRKTVSTLQVGGGRVIEAETENGTWTVERDRDVDRRVVRYVDQARNVYGYGYDAKGRLRSVTLPDGAGHRVDYDGYGRVVHVARDGVATIDYGYDAQTGLLAVEQWSTPTGAAERTVQWTYDAIGRKQREVHLDGSGATQRYDFYWDGATPAAPQGGGSRGLLTGVSGDGFTKLFTYRSDGKPAARTVQLTGWRSVTTQLDYAEAGLVRGSTTTVRGSDGAVLSTSTHHNEFDSYGRLASSWLNGAQLATFGYNPDGGPSKATFADGSTATVGYDSLTRNVTSLAQTSSRFSSSDSFKLNDRGFVDHETVGVGGQAVTRKYGYSGPGFLTSSDDAQSAFLYDFDSTGRPTLIADAAGQRGISIDGQTLQAGTVTYVLDGLGRTIRKGDLELSYGPNGQLARAVRGGKEWTFQYDENGQRLLKLAAGEPVVAYLDEGYLDAQGLTEPVTFGSSLVGVIQRGTFHLLATDVRGTVLADLDGTSRPASPFGDRAAHPDLAAAVDFVKKGYDADLGLVRMGVRDYDPSINRFLTPDPLFLADPAECVKSPVECNLYSYARNNPLRYHDPTGLAGEVADYDRAQAVIDRLNSFEHAREVVRTLDSSHTGAVTPAGRIPVSERTAPTPDRLVSVNKYGETPSKGQREFQLDRDALDAFRQLRQKAQDAGFAKDDFSLTSAYRPQARQEQLAARAREEHGDEAGKWVAQEHSEHLTGRAFDLKLGALENSAANASSNAFDGLATFQWLQQNAAQLGLNPYSAEPWHWSYNVR